MAAAAGFFSRATAMPHPSSIFAAYASVSAFVMLIQTLINQLIPRSIQQYILTVIRRLLLQRPKKNATVIVIEERDGAVSNNELYPAVETYLCTKITHNVNRLKLVRRHKDPNFAIRFAQSETLHDTYRGIKLKWRFIQKSRRRGRGVVDDDDDDFDDGYTNSSRKQFELHFESRHRGVVLDSYIPYIMDRAKFIVQSEKKVIKLFTLSTNPAYGGGVNWDSINLEHPSTFETLAMEPEVKRRITEDLDRFLRRKDFYRKVGKAWKRGYLLHGPPGTGKSSLIAAMANYLKFDIYDLELTNVKRDSDLRKILLRTANQSILVIEDIDCTMELPDRNGPKVTKGAKKAKGSSELEKTSASNQQFSLSGLLNFIDGLWSSCGDERIIVFTTNNREKLDPALLRPGRMDMHIHMSYLTVAGFRLLASTYLNVHDHDGHALIPKIENLIETMEVTPAEVAEELMKSDDVDVSLGELLQFLKDKKEKKENEVGVIGNEIVPKKSFEKKEVVV